MLLFLVTLLPWVWKQTDEGSYVKSYDGGVRIEIHNAQGFVPTKITSFLMNLHVQGKPVFIR